MRTENGKLQTGWPRARLERFLFLYIFLVAVFFYLFPSNANAGVQLELTRIEPIPRNYKTWSLFLICDQSWLLRERNRINQLFREFEAFGKAIGPDNLAVWFWGWKSFPKAYALAKPVQRKLTHLGYYAGPIDGIKGPETTKAIREYQRSVGLVPNGEMSISLLNSLGIQLDIPLSTFVNVVGNTKYCQKYGLKPSKSPYVVVTTSYPDLGGKLGDFWVMQLNGLPAEEISKVLGDLADQVVLGSLNQETLESARYWRAWEGVFRNFFAKLGGVASYIKKVTFEINTKFFRLEVEAEP